MFTGIIESTAPILEKTDSTLKVSRPHTFDDIEIGSSIALCGACLTVVSFDDVSMTFDVMPETWKCTRLGDMKNGEIVNLERALSARSRFEGHVVQGHVEDTGVVESLTPFETGIGSELRIRVPEDAAKYIVPKGSIAIDGVSLTVVDCKDALLSLALIPHTLENTTLGSMKKGDQVNIETDVLGRYVLQS